MIQPTIEDVLQQTQDYDKRLAAIANKLCPEHPTLAACAFMIAAGHLTALHGYSATDTEGNRIDPTIIHGGDIL